MSVNPEEKIRTLQEENKELRRTVREREEFIRRTFGRYLTDEVLEEILSEKGIDKAPDSRVAVLRGGSRRRNP